MKRVAHKMSFYTLILLGTSLVCMPGQHSDESIKLSAELVLVDAHILNQRTGQSVSNLRKEDFELYEDGVKQQIAHFSQDKLPLSVMLLMDVSGSVRPILDQVHEETLQALQQLKPEDEVALMVFAGSTDLLQSFTTNKELVARKIRVARSARVARDTFICEAVYQAAAHLHLVSNPLRRRILIAITDNLSDPAWRGHSEAEAVHELLQSGATLCGIILDWTDKLGLDERSMIKLTKRLQKRRSAGDVRTYAEKTGGVIVETKRESIGIKLAEIIQRLRTRYSLGYVPSNAWPDGSFRRIKLKLSRDVERQEGKVTIITREGYYAPRSDGMSEAAKERPSRGKSVKERD